MPVENYRSQKFILNITLSKSSYMGKVGGKASRGKSNLIESPISICPGS